MLSDGLNGSLVQPHTVLTSLEIRRLNYPKWAHQIIGFFLLIFGIFGLILNICVLLTFLKNRNLWSSANIFIIALAVSDLCMVVFAFPFSVTNSLNGIWQSGDATCALEAFIVYGFGMTACYLLTSISVDRYIAIVMPLRASLITTSTAGFAVFLSYGGGFLWAIAPFFGWSSYGLEAPGVSCGLNYEDQSSSTLTYLVAIFIFTFLFPLGIMSFCYSNVYFTVKDISRHSKAEPGSKEADKNLRIEKKILKTSVIMCVAFWACWTPYAIATFWAAFGDPESVPLAVTAIPAAAAKTEVVWNPLIYVATNRQFRRAFYGILPCPGLREKLTKRDGKVNPQNSKESNLCSNEDLMSLQIKDKDNGTTQQKSNDTTPQPNAASADENVQIVEQNIVNPDADKSAPESVPEAVPKVEC